MGVSICDIESENLCYNESPSTHLHVPVVRDLVGIVWQPVLVWIAVIVQLGGRVYDPRFLGRYALEAVVDSLWYLDQDGIPLAHEELVYHAAGGRAVAGVVQHDLGHS